uniref:Phospholipid-transporting ATPase n=1 Tax=Phytophthora ramorum TaxID=164328 RepID=H3HCU6_PHYRM
MIVPLMFIIVVSDGESSLKPRFVHPELCRPPYRDCFSSDGQHLTPQATTQLSAIHIDFVESQLVSSPSVQRNPYIPTDIKDSTLVDYIWLFLAYMLLFSNFVPISLQVTIDFTRSASALQVGQKAKPVAMEYTGPSPDERALVIAAAQAGVELRERNNTRVVARVNGNDSSMEILQSFEFTSDRKKSSIVFRESSGKIILMTKGADSVILAALSESANKPSAVLQAKDQMKLYSANGLRVLCIAEREISADEYRSWNSRYLALKQSSARGASEEDLTKIIAELERRLVLVGVSAIEDKIQEGAPEALEKFRAAGIRVWMLTGDRADTATNVAHAVRLVSAEMRLLRLCESASSWMEGQGLALLIDDMVVEAITGFGIEKEFLELCMECESVLCARISPKQKQLIVGMVRSFCPDKVTLAIGDGANDVPMIQGAHIGVGIAGEEGHQASDSSDYSLPAFRFLQRLVLVHGRGMNRRIAVLTQYVFYKNVLLVLPQFFFGAYCLYSGQSTYFDTLLQLFNIGFTALPVLVFSVKDDDISARTVLFYPRLYQDGFHHVFLNRKRFAYWMFEAVLGSALIILIPAELLPLASWSGTGKDNDLWALGMAQNLAVVVLASARLLLEATSSSRVLLVLATVSVLFWWLVTFVISSMTAFGREFYGILYVGAITNGLLLTLFCSITGLTAAFLPKAWLVFFAPEPRTICRERDQMLVDFCKKRSFETIFPIDQDNI